MKKPRIRLFATDLDGTLLGETAATARFAAAWATLKPGVRPLLVYNTGRTVEDVRGLVRAGVLPECDYIVGGVGTELFSNLYDYSREFSERFAAGWNLDQIECLLREIPAVRPQPSAFCHRFKSSWFWDDATVADLRALEQRLAAAAIEAQIVYSSQRFLDVLPAQGGKGNALAWLAQRLGIPLAQVLVAGDTGNDTSMFQLADVRGVIVGNALPELRGEADGPNFHRARLSAADGVVEGLRHFGVLPKIAGAEASRARG
ncbi:MAG TPA: HAD-IIB family hydrolase [Acidobacteriota bacterium]|nr:HAD-IIB family hydrolase [Acidobacteriota bacterium]